MTKFVLSPSLKVYSREGRQEALSQLKEAIGQDYPQIEIKGVGLTGMTVDAEQKDIDSLQQKFPGFFMEKAIQFHIPKPFMPGLG